MALLQNNPPSNNSPGGIIQTPFTTIYRLYKYCLAVAGDLLTKTLLIVNESKRNNFLNMVERLP